MPTHPRIPSLPVLTPSTSERELSTAARRGELVRVLRGAYVDADVWSEVDPFGREAARATVAARSGRVRTPLSRRAAAALWGVPLIGRVPATVDALAWRASATRTHGDVRYWGSRDLEVGVVELDGIAVTSLSRTLAEFAAHAPLEHGVAAVDWAIRVRDRETGPVTTLAEITAMADALGVVRGRRRLDAVLQFADGLAESPGESISRVAMARLGLEAPTLQPELVTPEVGRVRPDFGWLDARIVGEFDGVRKYRAADGDDGGSVEQIVVREKRREDALRALGFLVVRWLWSDANDLVRLGRVLQRAGVRRASTRLTRFATTRTARSV